MSTPPHSSLFTHMVNSAHLHTQGSHAVATAVAHHDAQAQSHAALVQHHRAQGEANRADVEKARESHTKNMESHPKLKRNRVAEASKETQREGARHAHRLNQNVVATKRNEMKEANRATREAASKHGTGSKEHRAAATVAARRRKSHELAQAKADESLKHLRKVSEEKRKATRTRQNNEKVEGAAGRKAVRTAQKHERTERHTGKAAVAASHAGTTHAKNQVKSAKADHAEEKRLIRHGARLERHVEKLHREIGRHEQRQARAAQKHEIVVHKRIAKVTHFAHKLAAHAIHRVNQQPDTGNAVHNAARLK